MLRVCLNGGYDAGDDPQNAEKISEFVDALVPRLLRRGHVIYGAARTDFDAHVAQAVAKYAAAIGEDDKAMLTSWVAKPDSGAPLAHNTGTLRESERPNWDPAVSVTGQPESIQRADVIVLVGGYNGVRRAFFWADIMRKPIIPVGYFGGAAREVYDREKLHFEEKYANRMLLVDYEGLVQIFNTPEEQADTVVRLIEDIAHPRCVITAMSYKGINNASHPLEAMFLKLCAACDAFGYQNERVDHTNTGQMIMQQVHKKLSGAAFAIVDLTEESGNVMYEAGFARGAGKDTILTARDGTKLPFDLQGDAVTFWQPDQLEDFQRRLEEKILPIAAKQGRPRRG